MRWLKLVLPAIALAAWLAASFAQQDAPPAEAPPQTRPPPAAPPPEDDVADAPSPAEDDEGDDVFIPTEELQPDAAVTFPVDI
jgi:hypothetical protein